MAFGIIVACLPVSAKFVQGVGETKAFTKFRISFKSHFNATFASHRSANNDRNENRKTSGEIPFGNMKARAKRYEALPNVQLSSSSHRASTRLATSENEFHQPEAYTMQTIDLDARSEPRGNNQAFGPRDASIV